MGDFAHFEGRLEGHLTEAWLLLKKGFSQAILERERERDSLYTRVGIKNIFSLKAERTNQGRRKLNEEGGGQYGKEAPCRRGGNPGLVKESSKAVGKPRQGNLHRSCIYLLV